ncbi:DUF1858 domain-containing protein [Anaerocolumna sp. AGMB13025]|uniref:DUF1858 domain-containing protein n=1 Tax=Anaerocolumna sp. AGMB13025 TaxID=3039116 RepID=UPI00241BF33A|nr:DUF1858 domain-containing protein [Anaerocolumna sp. AGMB13025]WFR56457.1 DUF1858 domain-containing protein [Anaerocolumna sp. AGMB13025]
MQEKVINLKQSVYEICSTNSEAAEILSEIGFVDITKPGMLKTAGRFMTIPKGAEMKKIDMDTVRQAFLRRGYKITE